MTGVRSLLPGLVGAAIVAVHLVAFPALIDHCQRDSLEVRVSSPPAAPALTIEATLPAGIVGRSRVTIDDVATPLASATAGPGLHHVEWRVAYRGGFERRVGTTQLVGPFQTPAAPPCSTRLIVGQSLLDDGKGSPGTIVYLAKKQIEAQMKGFKQWPIGSFEHVSELSVEWARIADRPALRKVLARSRTNKASLAPGDIESLLAIRLTLNFSRGKVPVFIGVSPKIVDAENIDLRVFSHATIDFESRVLQFLSDLFKGDKLANKTAQKEIKSALADIFTTPLPVPLPGGRSLRFDYCTTRGIEISTGRYAAIPLAMRLDGARPDILPITLGELPATTRIRDGARLAFEFDLDAINAVLYYLWRTEFLDKELDKADIPRRFNEDPRVDKLLSVRISDLSLSLPPTAVPRPGAFDFTLAAAATMTLTDGTKRTPARVYSAIGFRFGTSGTKLVADVQLADLRLTCEPRPGLLTPCYSDIVAQIRDNADDLHGELTRLFTGQFNRIVLNRHIGGPGLPRFAIRRATVRAMRVGRSGLVRVALFGGMEE